MTSQSVLSESKNLTTHVLSEIKPHGKIPVRSVMKCTITQIFTIGGGATVEDFLKAGETSSTRPNYVQQG